MGQRWVVSADLLARIRFVVSAFSETVAAITILSRPDLPGAPWIRVSVPALFLICTVGIVALYADDIRVSRLRRHGLDAPDDPDLGRPSH